MDYRHYCLKESLKRTHGPLIHCTYFKKITIICAIGGDLKNAKKIFNYTGEPFYNIPLAQVGINVDNVYKAHRTSCYFHKVCLPGFINIARNLHIHQVATLVRSFRFVNNFHQINRTVGQVKELTAMLEKGFLLTGGPFVKGLDLALQSFHVHRQQYHSGAFVGNHVHKSLQVSKQCKILC